MFVCTLAHMHVCRPEADIRCLLDFSSLTEVGHLIEPGALMWVLGFPLLSHTFLASILSRLISPAPFIPSYFTFCTKSFIQEMSTEVTGHISGNLNQSTVCRDCAVFRLRSRVFSCVLICFFSVNFLSHLSFFVLYSSLASAHPELAIHSYPSSHLGILTDLGNFLDDIHTPTGIRGPLTLLSV